MLKFLFNKSNFLRFLGCYIISQIISIVAYAVPVIVLAPLIMGSVVEKVSEYSESYEKFQDPINTAIHCFFCIAFFACLIILYLYRNKEMKLQFQKNTINECVLTRELAAYIKEYGIADLIYYTICSIVAMLLLGGGMESAIFVAIESRIVCVILCIFMFIVIYTISVLITFKVWDKQRPEYLKKGYVEKDNL